MCTGSRSRRVAGLLVSACVLAAPMISLAPPADAQVAPAGTAGSSSAAAKAGATTAPASRPLKQEELDQLLAPIALYPDQLLTQLLMASTYPLEIVQADRWVKANPKVKDKALSDALEKQTWDPSVKSLVNFPQVLAMMSEKLDLTIRLGDAFIAQQSDVLNTVQKLRGKAQTQGQLKNNEQQKVIVEAPPPQVSQTTVVVEQVTPPPAQIIKIEPTQPSVVYVPTYSPTVVYGGWPYPSYPPAPYYPPGYVASNVMSFGLGVACGAAWGYAWGNSNWGGGNVDIDVDRNTNFNRNINRESYKGNVSNRQNNISGGKGNWQHNSAHRGSVPYRDAGTANKYGGAQQRQASQARSDYRGRTDSGLGSTGGARASNNAAGGAGNRTGAGGAGVDNRAAGGAGGVGNRTGAGGAGVDNRSAAGGGGGGAGAGNRTGAGGSGSSGAGNRATPSAANRSSSSGGGGGSAFSGSGSGGSAARSSSARGQSSRSSSSGGSRSGGGGGSRGGGGGGRGGGGGGRR